MNFFNAVAADLVEKRLWPVAAVLGAGAVAAPVAAHLTSAQPSSEAPPPALQPHRSTAPHPSAAVQSLIAQLNPNSGVIPLRQGGFHDPFGSGAAGAAAVATASPGPSSGITGASRASTNSSATGTAPGGPAFSRPSPVHTSPVVPVTPVSTPKRGTPSPVVHTPTNPKHSSARHSGGSHDTLQVYSASLRFGQAADVQSVANPTRLSPLPSAADPEVVYLGVMRGGKRAAFLVPRTAVGSGDGICRPSPSQCQVVELRVGDSEFLDIHSPTAGLIQYELDLTHISSHRTASRAVAAKAHRRESAAGRELLKKASSTALAQLNFSPQSGAVYVRSKSALAPATKAGQTRSVTSPAAPPPAPATPQVPPAPGVVPAPPTPPQPAPAPRTGS